MFTSDMLYGAPEEFAEGFEEDFAEEFAEEFLYPPYDDYDNTTYNPFRSLADAYGKTAAYGGKKKFKADYTALSVAIWTLLIVLVVEVLRHKIDTKAVNRPFFKAVLEGVYGELATLGIVESIVYLMKAYIDGFTDDVKKVFAKVHFLLFYAAIFNAFMSVILAFISSRISDRMWIRTEELELNHYIAIREEFDRIDAKLRRIEDDGAAAFGRGHKGLWVQHPALKRKHSRLLVQVRFHELRVHFLQANDLPIKFKVSEYLKKSEVHVFKKMVHISTFAWLTVATALELVYFFMGITTYVSKNQRVVGMALSAIYFGLCVGFVPISAVIFYKMKKIFSQIMQMKLIDYKCDDAIEKEFVDDASSTASNDFDIVDRHQKHASLTKHGFVHQIDLFWGRDPHYIIVAFQFMQLGYALGAAILLIFYRDVINVKYAKIDGWWFIVALVVCYVAFTLIMAQVIPRYTLCTSLGQLVNRRRLHETMAKHRLEEAKRKRRQQLEEREIQRSMAASVKGRKGKLALMKKAVPASTRNLTMKISSSLLSRAGDSYVEVTEEESVHSEHSNHSDSSRKLAQLAELVQTSTRNLPSLPPPRPAIEIRKERRRNMKRSMSDGVSAMRSMSMRGGAGFSDVVTSELGDKDSELPPSSVSFHAAPAASGPSVTNPTQQQRRRHKSMSENVSAMRSPSLFAPGTNMSSSEEEKEEESMVGTPVLKSFGKPVRRVSSAGGLPALMEDIPSRSCGGANLDVPLGREQNGMVRMSTPRQTTGSEERVETKIRMATPIGEHEADDNDDDEDTIGSQDSEGGHSDFDDVPIAPSEKHHVPESLGDHLRSFFLSPKYRLMSAVAGTMIVFFIVGMRVEILLVEGPNAIMKNIGNTWHMNPSGAFWWEVTWLGLFISSSLFMCFLFFAKVGSSSKADDSYDIARIAAACDVILSVACLIILLWAEYMRDPCCKGKCYDSYDCGSVCFEFGSRVCGGLGQIEPFTSIIVLREFRYRFAAFILGIANKCNGTEKGAEHDNQSHLDKSVRPHEVHDGHEAHSLAHESGTIVELWKVGIGLYPHIVEKYGPFSSELLQAMLGLDIIEDDTGNGGNDTVLSHKRDGGTSDVTTRSITQKTAPALLEGGKEDGMLHEATNPSAMTLTGRYKKLDPKTQGIILAGQIGKPVCTQQTSNASTEGGNKGNRSPVVTMDATHPHGYHGDEGVEMFIGFELDEQQEAKEKAEDNHDEDLAVFVDPNACLIRSLRRCQRRLPPMLDTWTVVDVALTKYELVYFEASDAYDTTDGVFDMDPATLQKRHTVKQALIATKGGKGLRLRDVAIGRKVVGHLELKDIDIIKVEHHSPLSSREGGEVEVDDGMDSDVVQEEYWRLGLNLNMMGQRPPRHHRWNYVDEYRLKLHSKQGTLFLRFYHDLEESEMSPPEPCEDESVGHIHKNAAILWCQTIARLCGPDQLHQKLPHFGEEGSAELRDFLELVDRGSTFAMPRRHTRGSAAADLSGPNSPLHNMAQIKGKGMAGMSSHQMKSKHEVFSDQTEQEMQNEESFVGLPV